MWNISYPRYITISLLFFSLCTAAQVKDQPIEIRDFSVSVRANMFIATTAITIEFYNPNNKVLDGEYNFSLKQNQVITGFELDINGFMRQGVVTEKQKGRIAYENTIRRRIDPGLLEMTAGNNYKVRIYPMPANGTRKIRIIINEQLGIRENALQYQLPLDIPTLVSHFGLQISAAPVIQRPVTGIGLLEGEIFQERNDSFFLQKTSKNIMLKGALSFSIPLGQQPAVICASKEREMLSFAMHVKPAVKTDTLIAFSSATIFWDVSSSAVKRDIDKEIKFLEKFINEKNLREITAVVFSNAINESRTFYGNSLAKNVSKFLRSHLFDGGTQLGVIDCNKFNADIFFLFSDGLSNFGTDKISTNDKPVNCINSSPVSNHSLLNSIAHSTGGRYIDLYTLEPGAAMTAFNKISNKLLGIKAGAKNIPVSTALPLRFDDWFTVTGQYNSSAGNDLFFSLGDAGKELSKQFVQIPDTGDCNTGTIQMLRKLQIYQQAIADDNKQLIMTLGKENRLVTENTSLIVLDNLQDYIQFGIEPPADPQDEYRKQLYVIKQNEERRKEEEENAVVNNLRKSITLYNERIGWWDKNEQQISLKAAEKPKEESVAATSTNDRELTDADVQQGSGDNNFKISNNALSEVVVVAYGTQRRMNLTGSVTTIRSSELSSGALNVQQVLAGRVAGLVVTNSDNGRPGSVPRITIRGAGSVFTNNEPLYILDGIPIDGELASIISVHNIETITVLKGIQASILYGSRAANGAIIIVTKNGYRSSSQYKAGVAKYKELEDVEYIAELKEIDKELIYGRYLQLKDSLGKEPSFYFDMAEVMFESGDKIRALRILSNLAELENENHQLQRAMGYMLEKWAMYEEAIGVYKKVLLMKEEEPQSYRDLALAYDKNGDHQQAVNILYQVLTKNWFQYEDRYRGLKSMLLNEMNAIIAVKSRSLDLSAINTGIIKPLPVDLRIVIDWNKDETDVDLHIVEPGGEECYYGHRQSKNGGRLSEDFTQGYGPEEYQVKQAVKGRYSIRVNYYGDRYQKQQVPTFIKVTVYKNFGKPDQTITVENLIMDNQHGVIEIADVKWK